jgi:type I restriction enzyme S subunit
MVDKPVVPEGWTSTTLGNLGLYLNGRAFKKSEWSKTGRPIIRIQDLTGSNDNPNYFSGHAEERYVVRSGDFLISWAATLGAYIWDGPEAVLNQHIFKVESNVHKRFHYHLVRERIAELQRSSHGSGMTHVTKDVFESLPVAVPPDPKAQALIAALIDRAEEAERSASRHIATAKRALDQFRQAVLLAAAAGGLTEDWRVSNPDDAAELLRMLAQSAGKIDDMSGAALGAEIPTTWKSISLGIAIEDIQAGKSFRAQSRPATPHEWGVIKVSAMSWGEFRQQENKAIPEGKEINSSFEIKPGDLLLSRANTEELVGVTVLVQTTRPKLLLSDKSLRLVPRKGIDPNWLNIVLRSPVVRRQFSDRATGTSDSMRNLSQVKILATALPLPPTREQSEIARRVRDLLNRADRIEERIMAVERNAERCTHAVLAKAFRGELAFDVAKDVSTRRQPSQVA